MRKQTANPLGTAVLTGYRAIGRIGGFGYKTIGAIGSTVASGYKRVEDKLADGLSGGRPQGFKK